MAVSVVESSTQSWNSALSQSTQPVFETVSVLNSDDVHFGNTTIIHGNITIERLNSSEIKSVFTKNTEKDSTRHKALCTKTLTIILVVLLLSVILLILLYAIIFIKVEPQKVDVIQKYPNVSFVSRSAWSAQPVASPLQRLQHPVPLVMIVYTVTSECNYQFLCIQKVQSMQKYHLQSRGWPDIGYNFLVGGDGAVYEGRGWDSEGEHEQIYQDICITIAFIGNFNRQAPPKQQISAFQKLIDVGVQLGKLSKNYKLIGHSQLYASSYLDKSKNTFLGVIEKWHNFVPKSSLQKHVSSSIN